MVVPTTPLDSNYKIAVVGDIGVGKSGYTQRLLSGQFDPCYTETVGVDFHNVKFELRQSGHSPESISFIISDWTGSDNFGSPLHNPRNFEYVQAVIVMFDLTSRTTFNRLNNWIQTIRNVQPDIPIVVCGSKCDSTTRISHIERQSLELGYSRLKYYSISSKTGYQLHKPLIHLARELTQRLNLNFSTN